MTRVFQQAPKTGSGLAPVFEFRGAGRDVRRGTMACGFSGVIPRRGVPERGRSFPARMAGRAFPRTWTWFRPWVAWKGI